MRKKIWKRALSLLLALALLCAAAPRLALPASAEVLSGSCGANLTWTLDTQTGVLSIAGSGNMMNYSGGDAVPWCDCRSMITSVSLPEGLKTIGAYAFYGCTGLTSVTIPDSAAEIRNNAFDGCSALRSVTLSDKTQTILPYAFYRCTSLEAMTIPRSVGCVSYNAFCSCTSLHSVTVYNLDCGIVYSAGTLGVPGQTTLYSYTNSTTDYYARNYGYNFVSFGYYNVSGTCGSNLTWAYYGQTGALAIEGSGDMDDFEYYGPWRSSLDLSRIKSVALPDGLTSIGCFAFSECEQLAEVTIPESVTKLGEEAFSQCLGLTSVTIPGGVTEIGDHVFFACTDLISVVFSCGITDIGTWMFSSCFALKSVTFPESLRRIGDFAFFDCSSLEAVVLPESVTSIGEEAFYQCSSLASVAVFNPTCEISQDKFTLGDPNHTVLYGRQNSTLQAYAEEYGYTFCPLDGFLDVNPTAWYAVPVAWAYENGITTGTGSESFSPNKACTREQIMTMLWRACDSPEPAGTELPFTDVKAGAYYEDAVRWAYYHTPQITAGAAAGTFGVGQTCNRAQTMTFLWAAAGKPEPTAAENPFEDVAETDYYYKAVLWAVENGVTSGTTPTTFSPNAPCTRAQVVTFLYKAAG